MDRAGLALLVGLAANCVTFVQLTPQILKLWRTGRTEGVSPAWALLGTTSNVGWLAFVVATGVWIAIPSIVVAIVGFSLTFQLLHRNGARIGLALRVSAANCAALVVIGITLGWIWLGTILAMSFLVQFTPPVVAVWRSRAPVGVSAATWFLALTEGTAWGLYGVLLEGDESGPIILYGLAEILTSSLVLIRVWEARERVRMALREQ